MPITRPALSRKSNLGRLWGGMQQDGKAYTGARLKILLDDEEAWRRAGMPAEEFMEIRAGRYNLACGCHCGAGWGFGTTEVYDDVDACC